MGQGWGWLVVVATGAWPSRGEFLRPLLMGTIRKDRVRLESGRPISFFFIHFVSRGAMIRLILLFFVPFLALLFLRWEFATLALGICGMVLVGDFRRKPYD